MDKETAKALEKSIAHWERHEGCKSRGEVNREGCGTDGCALCALFYDNGSCASCPVSQSTGESCCLGTPHQNITSYLRPVSGATFSAEIWSGLAGKMRQFLESLRDQKDAGEQAMPYTQKIQAISMSVEHWRRLEKCKTHDEVVEEGCSGDECALCLLYRTGNTCDTCGKCPVALKTGKGDCAGSPYGNAEEYFTDSDPQDGTITFDAEQWRWLAKAERVFLYKLLLEASEEK